MLIQLSLARSNRKRDRYHPAGKQIIISVVEHAYRLFYDARTRFTVSFQMNFQQALGVYSREYSVRICRKESFSPWLVSPLMTQRVSKFHDDVQL